MGEATTITTQARRNVTVTADLASTEQWERTKTYAKSIRYRVTEVRVTARDDSQGERVTFVGPRILKDGSESQRVFDDSYSNALDDIPEAIRTPIAAALDAWRAAS